MQNHRGKNYLGVLSICNVARSTLVRESDWVCLTSAGAEYGVASTKAFTTQLVALWCLSEGLGKSNYCNIHQNIKHPISQILKKADTIKQVASLFHEYKHMLFLGRGQLYPIAQEGALKLKEISYIHAEAYALVS